MSMNSQFVGFSVSETRKSLARILSVSILAVSCAALAGCATGNATQANAGGCYKCAGFQKSVSQHSAALSQTGQPAADQ
jgi:hypothetical protein